MPNISYNSDVVKTVDTVIAVSDMNKDLNNQIPTEITCELEELSPGINIFYIITFLILFFSSRLNVNYISLNMSNCFE